MKGKERKTHQQKNKRGLFGWKENSSIVHLFIFGGRVGGVFGNG